MSGLIWVQTVCRGYQQTTKVASSGKRAVCKIVSDDILVIIIIIIIIQRKEDLAFHANRLLQCQAFRRTCHEWSTILTRSSLTF